MVGAEEKVQLLSKKGAKGRLYLRGGNNRFLWEHRFLFRLSVLVGIPVLPQVLHMCHVLEVNYGYGTAPLPS